MALLTTVNKTSGNYETTFIYTIDANFAEYIQEITAAEIKIEFPNELNYYIGDFEEPITGYTETPTETGTEIVFSIDDTVTSGTSLRIGIGVTFKLEAVSGYTYEALTTMSINGIESESYTSEIIELVLNPNFDINREVILPSSKPASGGAVFYKLTLENNIDIGSEVDGVVITCFADEYFTFDETFEVVGYDASKTGFEDTRADGFTADFVDGNLVFTIGTYRGEIYEFIYRTVLIDNITIGTEIDTLATLSITGEEDKEDITPIVLGDVIYLATASVYGPTNSMPGENIGFECSFQNTGNQVLENVVIKNTLPQEVQYTEIRTGSIYYGAINLDIDYEYYIDYVTDMGTTNQMGPFNTNTSETVDLTTYIPNGENLVSLTWNLDSLGVGVTTKAVIEVNGVVKDGTEGLILSNGLRITSDNAYVNANSNTEISNFCVLTPVFESSIGTTPVRPGDTFSYTIGANCRWSRLSNPIFAMYLDEKLEFVEGSEILNYDNYFTPETIPEKPIAQVLPNFAGDGKTLIKFEFKEPDTAFDFMQKTEVSITFNVKVLDKASGDFESVMLLNVLSKTGKILDGTSIYYDYNNIAEDSDVKAEYAESASISNTILIYIGADSKLMVKGAVDEDYVEYPVNGMTYEGGKVNYKIVVENKGNTSYDSIEVVNILPYLGDSFVTVQEALRGSEFSIINLTEASVVALPEGTEIEFDMYYSRSTNPTRFSNDGTTIIGDDDWTTEVPENPSEIKAIKLVTKNTEILPGELVEVYTAGIAQIGVNTGEIAYNSFAAEISYTDMEGVQRTLLPIEPQKVGVEIIDVADDKGVIKGTVFFDENGDGIYEVNSENGIDEVGVLLYNEDGSLHDLVFTSTDASGNSGKFQFSDLELSNYYVKFVVDSDEEMTVQNLVDEYGSVVDPSTNLTPLYTLTEENKEVEVYAGVVEKGATSISDIIKVNNSARSMVRNVIYNQMLIGMKHEDVIELIQNS